MDAEWIKDMSLGCQRSWDEFKLIGDNWDGPLLKGIQCAADAKFTIHGGRQIDGGVFAPWSLEHIMRSTKVKETQATGKFTALFDFSVRTGPDIFKVPASGTQAVLRKSLFLSHSSSQSCYGLHRTVTDRYCPFIFLLVE